MLMRKIYLKKMRESVLCLRKQSVRLVGSARQDEVRAVFVLKVKVGVEDETEMEDERRQSLTCNRTGPDEMRREAKEVRWAAAPVGTDEGARSQEMTQFPQHPAWPCGAYGSSCLLTGPHTEGICTNV